MIYLNYLTYIKTATDYVRSLENNKLIQYIDSIYLVRGFAKADIRVGQSDIDLVIILKEECRGNFKRLTHQFFENYQNYILEVEERKILSIPKVLFFREFEYEHYVKFTEYGIPFKMEAELFYGQPLLNEVRLAEDSIGFSLFQNLVFHLSRYFHRVTDTLFGNTRKSSIIKRARRSYFYYIWHQGQRYIMNTRDLFDFLKKEKIVEGRFFEHQYYLHQNMNEPLGENYFADSFDFYKDLYLPLANKYPQSVSEEVRSQIVVDTVKLQSDKEFSKRLNAQCTIPGAKLYYFKEWRDSWLSAGSSNNTPYIYCVFEDQVTGQDIVNDLEKLKQIRSFLQGYFSNFYFCVIFESLFNELVTRNFPVAGLTLNQYGSQFALNHQSIVEGYRKNFSFALYDFPFLYIAYNNDLSSDKDFYTPGPVFHLAKVMADYLAMTDGYYTIYPEDALRNFNKRYGQQFGTIDHIDFLLDCLNPEEQFSRLDLERLVDIFFDIMNVFAQEANYPYNEKSNSILDYHFKVKSDVNKE